MCIKLMHNNIMSISLSILWMFLDDGFLYYKLQGKFNFDP